MHIPTEIRQGGSLSHNLFNIIMAIIKNSEKETKLGQKSMKILSYADDTAIFGRKMRMNYKEYYTCFKKKKTQIYRKHKSTENTSRKKTQKPWLYQEKQ